MIPHFAELIHHQAERYGQRVALLHRDPRTGKWLGISWNAFADRVRLTSQALIEYGIGVQENIGIYAPNMPQYFYTAFGAYGARAVEVPMYPTGSPDQIKYIVRDANIRLLFVGEQQQYNNAYKAQQEMGDTLRKIVIFDRSVVRYPTDETSVFFEEFVRLGDNARAETAARIRRNEATDDDVALIIYTSGTTGEPKGVVITHANFREMMRIHTLRLPMVTERDLSMCFLPLVHIFEKGWTNFCLCRGVRIAINRDPKMIRQTLLEAPTNASPAPPGLCSASCATLSAPAASMSSTIAARARRLPAHWPSSSPSTKRRSTAPSNAPSALSAATSSPWPARPHRLRRRTLRNLRHRLLLPHRGLHPRLHWHPHARHRRPYRSGEQRDPCPRQDHHARVLP